MTALDAKILIVDDDPRMRGLVRELLQAPGRHFLEASDGSEAVELHRIQKPNLILMDIDMTPMDGITAARLIKERDPSTRVIILTHHDQAAFRNAASRAGASAFVSKDDLTKLIPLFEQEA